MHVKINHSVKLKEMNRERFHDNSLGIKDAYFIGHSRDYFEPYELNGFKGYEIYNCVGSFILAVKEAMAKWTVLRH
jgi:hypothetical protein